MLQPHQPLFFCLYFLFILMPLTYVLACIFCLISGCWALRKSWGAQFTLSSSGGKCASTQDERDASPMAALSLVIMPVKHLGMGKWALFELSTWFLSLAIIPFPLITLANSYSDSWCAPWAVFVCWIHSDRLLQFNSLPFLYLPLASKGNGKLNHVLLL